MYRLSLVVVIISLASAQQFQGPPQHIRTALTNPNEPEAPASSQLHHLPPPPPGLPPNGVIIEPAQMIMESHEEEELGFVDSVLGEGTQSRIVSSVGDWVSTKAKENPGCVERFVCETYKTGESLTGLPYLAMQISNAALSFMVAEMFDNSIDIKEITRAARYGRTMGTCRTMQCDFMDGQLRTLGDYLGSFEEFISSIISSVSNSINLGKKKR